MSNRIFIVWGENASSHELWLSCEETLGLTSVIVHIKRHKLITINYLRLPGTHLLHLVLYRVVVSQGRMGAGNAILAYIRIYLKVFDFLTVWIYNIIHRPGAKLKEYSAVRAVPCKPIKPWYTQVTYKPIPINAEDYWELETWWSPIKWDSFQKASTWRLQVILSAWVFNI